VGIGKWTSQERSFKQHGTLSIVFSLDGKLTQRFCRPEVTEGLSIFTPETLEEAEKSGKLDIDSNPLDLRPDPAHFVGFLKTMNQPDVSSSLFVRLLEAYRGVKSDNEGDPLRYAAYSIRVHFALTLFVGRCCTSSLSCRSRRSLPT
jgi:hypothetical protein